MCVCGADELEAHGDVAATFTVVEQSPAGVTWSYEVQIGVFNGGRLGTFDEEGAWDPMIEIEFADSGPDLLEELVAIDEINLWMLGQSGIYRVPVVDLSVPGLGIKDGVGMVGFTPYDDYRFRPAASGEIDDMDIANGFVWWIEGRIVYRMAVDDFDGTPEEMFDVTDDFGTPGDPALLAAGTDRLWILLREQNPILRAYQFDGDLIEEIEIDSEGATIPRDMTVERNSGVLAISSHTTGD